MIIYGLSQLKNCFKNVIKWASDNDNGNILIVHGKVVNLQSTKIDHAWIEQGDMVNDPTSESIIIKEKYYRLVQAEPEAKLNKH